VTGEDPQEWHIRSNSIAGAKNAACGDFGNKVVTLRDRFYQQSRA
jgi:hypothetical protein